MQNDPFRQRDMFDEWSRKLHEIMDQMLEREFFQFRQFRDAGTWQPAMNVYETPTTFLVCVDLAGMHQDAINVELHDDCKLTISGERPQPRPEQPTGPISVYAMEIDEGKFTREIELPASVRTADIEANYSNGLLWITIPKRPRDESETKA